MEAASPDLVLPSLADILKDDPQNFGASYLLGVIAYETERFGVAATYLLAATEINPRSEVSHHSLGLAHHETGDQSSITTHLFGSVQGRSSVRKH